MPRQETGRGYELSETLCLRIADNKTIGPIAKNTFPKTSRWSHFFRSSSKLWLFAQSDGSACWLWSSGHSFTDPWNGYNGACHRQYINETLRENYQLEGLKKVIEKLQFKIDKSCSSPLLHWRILAPWLTLGTHYTRWKYCNSVTGGWQ